jgi:hypothetical protein
MHWCTWVCASAGCVYRFLRRKQRVTDSGAWMQGPGDKDLKKKIKQKPNNDDDYDWSRYKPALRTVIEVTPSRLLPLGCC